MIVQFITTYNKNDMPKYSKILSELDITAEMVYSTHTKNIPDPSNSEYEKNRIWTSNSKRRKTTARSKNIIWVKGRNGKQRIDESKKRAEQETREKD